MSTTSPEFPDNPTNGQIYESSPGVFFQYSTLMNSWSRIFTSEEQQLATSERDGLMTFEDFNKLTGLRLPPPSSTLTPVESVVTSVPGDPNNPIIADQTISGCKTFSDPLSIESGDKFIAIEFSNGNIHDATAQIDIGIDTDALIHYLESTGQFRSTSPAGARGPRGKQGDPGLNALSVGPYGIDGVDGSPIWSGSLVEETVMVRSSGNKAIVNITASPISSTENYLIAERATIGNPYACPDTILPTDIQSPWLLGIKKNTSTSTTSVNFVHGPVDMDVDDAVSSPKCGISGSGTCGNDLYYFNVENIIRDIYDEWRRQLLIVKEDKENQMIQWLSEMSTLFEQQKAALCCSLEAIVSRKRNADTRRYIESQSIAALQANRTIELSEEPQSSLSTAYELFHLSDSDCNV